MVDINEFDDFDQDDEEYEATLAGGLVPAPGAKSSGDTKSWPETIRLVRVEFDEWIPKKNALPGDKTLKISSLWAIAEISQHDEDISPNVGEVFTIRHYYNFTAGKERKESGHGKMYRSMNRFWGKFAECHGIENDYNGNVMKLFDLHLSNLKGAPFTAVLKQKFTDFGADIEIRSCHPLEETEDE